MNFLTTPGKYVRTQRTSRDVCRDAVAIQRPAKRATPAHEIALYIVAAIAVATLLFIV